MTPTYLEQEKHIHEQYIAGLIQPLNYAYCFCGNMLGKRLDRAVRSHERFWPYGSYTAQELSAIEDALFMGIMTAGVPLYVSINMLRHPRYEVGLFNGMVKALETLKNIHIAHGEIVDVPVTFTRRAVPEPV